MKATPYYVGGSGLLPAPAGSLDNDPHGILWMWEEPDPRATYVVGVDPSGGIPLWNRHARSESDFRVDNGAIEVLRCGRGAESTDRQVAEFAAPIDPEDLADVVNVIGRVYAGSNEDKQARCIIEVHPGPGLLTQRKLISYGYTNLYLWTKLDQLTTTMTKSFGWYSTSATVKILWTKCVNHLLHGGVDLYSTHLIEEMADCEMDMNKGHGRSLYGHHDDRVRALMLAIWVARDYSIEVETLSQEVRTTVEHVNPQATDMTYDQMMEWADELFANMGEE